MHRAHWVEHSLCTREIAGSNPDLCFGKKCVTTIHLSPYCCLQKNDYLLHHHSSLLAFHQPVLPIQLILVLSSKSTHTFGSHLKPHARHPYTMTKRFKGSTCLAPNITSSLRHCTQLVLGTLPLVGSDIVCLGRIMSSRDAAILKERV